MLVKTKKNVAYSLEQPLSTMPLEPILAKRAPTTEDRTDIGRMWIDQVNGVPYILVSISNLGVARWVTFGGEYDSLETITGNTGGAVPGDVNDNINVIGTNVLSFDGNFATNTIEASLVNGADGQLLIGGGAEPIWANLTSSNGSIAINNGPNSIDLTFGNIDSETFTGNTGDVVSPIAGNVNIVGDGLITVDGDDTTGTLSVALTNPGSDGQVLLGSPSGPSWGNLTSTDGSIDIINSPNAINLQVAGGISGNSNFFSAIFKPIGTLPQSGLFRIVVTNNIREEGLLVEINYLFGTIPTSANPGLVLNAPLGQPFNFNVLFDVGNNFFPGDGVNNHAKYTAPLDGIYQFSMTLNGAVSGGATGIYLQVEGDPSRTIGFGLDFRTTAGGPGTNLNPAFCELIQLFAGESVLFGLKFNGPVLIIQEYGLQISGMRVGDI